MVVFLALQLSFFNPEFCPLFPYFFLVHLFSVFYKFLDDKSCFPFYLFLSFKLLARFYGHGVEFLRFELISLKNVGFHSDDLFSGLLVGHH